MMLIQDDSQHSGSIVHWMRQRLRRKSNIKGCANIADEVAKVVIDKAKEGEFNFVNLLIQRCESQDLTREEALVQIEHFYNTVQRHVTDPKVLQKISQDLTKYKERIDGGIR